MLGVNSNGSSQKKWEVIATFIIVFAINVLMLLPEGSMPTPLDVYRAIRNGLLTALIIYAVNKGIEWRRKNHDEKKV